MSGQRQRFLLLATLATAAASLTVAFGQTVTPVVEPTSSGTRSAAAIPDFSGIWSHLTFPDVEPPLWCGAGAEPFARDHRSCSDTGSL